MKLPNFGPVTPYIFLFKHKIVSIFCSYPKWWAFYSCSVKKWRGFFADALVSIFCSCILWGTFSAQALICVHFMINQNMIFGKNLLFTTFFSFSLHFCNISLRVDKHFYSLITTIFFFLMQIFINVENDMLLPFSRTLHTLFQTWKTNRSWN